MKFFTHFYLENHMYFNDYLKYVLIFAALVVLLLAVSQYLRHRMDTKYRDLSIIALLLLILISGIQYLSLVQRTPKLRRGYIAHGRFSQYPD